MGASDRITPRSVIPFRIPMGASLPVQLLDARSRVSAVSGADDGFSVRAAIDVEAWFRAADGSVGCRREVLAAILRGEDLPPSAQPSIVAEQYLLCSSEHPAGAAVLQGELRLAWMSAARKGPSPSTPARLEVVVDRRRSEIPVRVCSRFAYALHSVVEARIDHESTACWEGGRGMVRGAVRVDLVVEYADGTLGRQSEAAPFELSEPMEGRPGQRIHAFTEPLYVSPVLDQGGLSVTVQVLLSAVLVVTETETVEIWQPPRLENGGLTRRVILSTERRLIGRTGHRILQRVPIAGVPAGPVEVSLSAAPPQKLGRTVVQEVTATCDVYFAQGGEERHYAATVEEVLLNPMDPSDGHLSSEVVLEGPAALAPGEDGAWSLAVPVEWRLYAEEIRRIEAVESSPAADSVEAVVEELVSRSPVRFLVPLPEVSRKEEIQTRLDFQCVTGAGHCRFEGRLSMDTYISAPGSPQKMVPVEVPFSETIGVPSCMPGMAAHCSLEVTVVPMGRPVAMVEGMLTLSRRRTAWLVRGVPPAPKAASAVDCHLFWRSERPIRGREDPIRIEARAEELVWRRAGDHLLIQGRLGRVLYFTDPGGRLYCSAERIPFSALTCAPDLRCGVNVSVAQIETRISPAKRRDMDGIEEEYLLRLELSSDDPAGDEARPLTQGDAST